MQKMRRWIVVLLVVSLLGSSVGMVPAFAAGTGSQDGDWTYDADAQGETYTYYYYSQDHKDALSPKQEVPVDVTQFQITESAFAEAPSATKVYDKYEGVENSENVVYIEAKGEKVTFKVDIPETGLYALELNYYPLADSSTQYLFGMMIDGETPFVEANSCVLSRVWKNNTIVEDEFGDDLRPDSVQTPEWRTQFLYDQNGVYGTLKFYLEAGTHDITLCFDGTPVLLKAMTFKQEPFLMSYQDYISLNQQKGYENTTEQMKLFQAEHYYRQSSAMLWPDADKSSSLTQPFSYKNIKINYGGGSQWKQPGHWITWEIEAPESGFYNIGCKYRQTYLDGLFSSRKIYIDGAVPFAEMNAVRFDYASSWTNMLLGDENGAYSVYLEKGPHTITMENVIGDLSDTMSVLQTVINNLNDLYLSVVMITSSNPDPYRDYNVEKQLPNLPADFRANAELLSQEAARLEQIVGKKGAENAYFEDVAYNLGTYADNIKGLHENDRITNFKNDINGLSAKLSAYQEQALDLDYIALVSPGEEMPKTEMNFWQWLVFQVRSFFASFGNKRIEESEKKSIRVWVNTGIDQFEIMKNMITDEFTPMTGIEVDLELAQGSLINALASGTGPDVMTGVTSDTVVNLALRGAVTDLSQYDGFQEILDQYVEGAEIPFELEGKKYGMPNTNGCSVMFIRTDIFENMGLEVPQTWDDVYDVAQVLQRYNMTIGAVASFANLLYQNGGTYFNDKLTEVCFNDEVAVKALVQHSEFYTKYGFPVSFDFANRFRTGEMPIGIADYTQYTSLKYTAPEISGLWEMYPIPGTIRNDIAPGYIDRTQMDQSGSGVVLLSSCDDDKKDAAWEFIKWWSDSKAQTRYGKDVEAALGISARYATANLITLRNLGWTTKELKILEEQFEWLQFIPIVPGNYYVTRGLNNSVRGVIDHGENAREILTEWTIKINSEIERKRNEFNLNN